MPTVDVFLPSYNHAKFLDRRITSILNQTHRDLRLIIYDDGSSDSSLEVIKKYLSDGRLIEIHETASPSGSPFGNWENFANSLSSDYLWVAESDDFAEETFLEEVLLSFVKFPDVGMALALSNVVDENNNQMGAARDYFANPIVPVKSLGQYSRYSGRALNEGELIDRNPFPNISAILFKSQLFAQAVHSDRSKYYYLRDWLLYQQILAHQDVCVLGKRLNNFRFHVNTTRGGLKPQAEWVRLMYERMRVREHASIICDQPRALTDLSLKEIYAKFSARMNVSLRLENVISELQKGDGKIYVYGAGSLGDQVSSLILQSKISCRFEGFLDKRSDGVNAIHFKAREVHPPEYVNCLPATATIVVASIEFEDEILHFLKSTRFSGKVLSIGSR